jgi:hypothetical protein
MSNCQATELEYSALLISKPNTVHNLPPQPTSNSHNFLKNQHNIIRTSSSRSSKWPFSKHFTPEIIYALIFLPSALHIRHRNFLDFIILRVISGLWPPLWSSGKSFWLQIQRSRVLFPALSDFLRSGGSGTGSTQPREDKWAVTWMKK